MSHLLIAGGGAAGMMAAVAAAAKGHKVTICEKNDRLGKKLYITGKGRCNITNACDMETLFDNVVTNRKFLYSAFYGFTNYDAVDLFEKLGLRTKVERGGRVFPVSDKSSDVISALQNELNRLNVDIRLRTAVKELWISEGSCCGAVLEDKRENKEDKIRADAVLVATGGISYPSTGSTGDGYRFAGGTGHTVTDTSPSLVPFNIAQPYVKDLQGLSLKNICVTVTAGTKEVYHDFGEMLFTHFGVSGPVILSASSYLVPFLKKKKGPVSLKIDLKPALTDEQLDLRILRDFEELKNKQFANALDKLLPKKMIPVIIGLSGIDPYKKVNVVTREERSRLIHNIKEMELTVTGLRGYNEAIITKGGIAVRDINPATMESKLVRNLYFAGEVLDLDALTGGFNLQIAWSTGYAAGNAV